MFYLVTDHKADKVLAEFKTQAEAESMASGYVEQGIYTLVNCYDSKPFNNQSFVYSSNEQNWVGDNGNWNTNS